jgi:hypothetical protein
VAAEAVRSADDAVAPAVLDTRRERALQGALDAVRLPLTRLVRSVAERLTCEPTQVGLATLEVEVRDALLAMGRDLLTELLRLRGTGSRGHSYICACGVRLVLKEMAPLQQRTWFGTITLVRDHHPGAGRLRSGSRGDLPRTSASRASRYRMGTARGRGVAHGARHPGH